MREPDREEIEKRAHELLELWRRSQQSATRGGDAELAALVGSVSHYVPYVLATIFYSLGVFHKVSDLVQESDRSRNVAVWIDESIDRVLQFAPLGKVCKEDCRSDLRGVVEELPIALGNSQRVDADLVANRLFNALAKYEPGLGERERQLVEYLVRAELTRLSP